MAERLHPNRAGAVGRGFRSIQPRSEKRLDPPPPPAFKSRFAVDSRLRRDATWMRGGQVKVRLMRDDMTAIRWTGDESSNTKVGSDLNDRLLGLGGDDTLTGRLGDDTIYGGSGNDRLRGE